MLLWEEQADDETLVAAAQGLTLLLTPASPTLVPSAAFTELYTRYLPRIYRFCCNRLGDVDAAEDATSEVFLHAFAHLPDYRSGSFGAWLYTIARNVVVGHYRRRRPNVSLAAAEAEPAGATSDPAQGYAERSLLCWALEQLNEEQRTAVELPAAGWPDAQIGEILGKSEAAVRMLRYRAMQRLQQLLADTQGANTQEARIAGSTGGKAAACVVEQVAEQAQTPETGD